MDISPTDIEEALQRPDSFMYFGDDRDKMFKSWSLGPVIRTRDSGLLDQSNADALEAELTRLEKKREIEKNSWRITRSSHWAVGHVDHLSFRVLNRKGEPTKVFRFIKEWFRKLEEEYPIADTDDYQEREYAATLENIEWEGSGVVKSDAPKDWAAQVFSWLWDTDQESLESMDDRGGYPGEDKIREAAEALGFAELKEATDVDERD